MVKEPKFDSKQIDAELSQAENDSKARSFIGAISKKSAPTIKEALANVVPDITRITKELNKKENDDGLPELPDIGDNGNDFIKESTVILSSLGRSSNKKTQLNAELSRKITLITNGKSVKSTDSQVESIVKLPQLETTINAITTVQKVNTQGFKNVINSVYDLSNITRAIYTQELSQLQTINKSLTDLAKVSNIGGAGAISQAGSIENLLTTGFSMAKLTKAMEVNAAKSFKTSWLKGSSLQSSEMGLLDILQGIQTNPTGTIAQFLVSKGMSKILGGEKIQKINTAAREASLSIFNTLQDPELLKTNKTFKKILTTGDKIANNKFLKHIPLVNLLSEENFKNGLKKLNKDIFGGKYDLTSKFDSENKVDKSTAVPFDMGTHVTINEVIPGYLAKILSVITGQPEIYNDYDSGKRMTKKELNEKIAKDEKSSLKSGFKTKRLKDLVKDVWGEDAGDKSDLLSSIVKNAAIHKEDLEKLKDGKNDSDIDELIKFIDSGTFKKLSYRNAIVSLRSKYNSIKYNTASGSAKNAYTFNNDLYQKLGLSKILKQEPTNNSSTVETTSSTDTFELLTTIDSTVTEIKNILEGWWDDTTFSNPFSPSPTKPKPPSSPSPSSPSSSSSSPSSLLDYLNKETPSPTKPKPSSPSPTASGSAKNAYTFNNDLHQKLGLSKILKQEPTNNSSTVAGAVEKSKLSVAKDLLTTKVGGTKESFPPITKKPKVSLGTKGVAGAVLATGGKVIKGTSSAVGKLPSKVKGVPKATSTVTGAKTISNTTLGKLTTSSSTDSVTKGKATTVDNSKATTVDKDKTVKSKAKVADKDEVLKQIKENAEKYNESAEKQNKLLEKENLKFLALAKSMSKGSSTLAATSKGASAASTATKAAAKTGILGNLLKGLGIPLALILGAGGLLLKGSTASADELTGNTLDNAVSPNIKTALDKNGSDVSRQALYMSPVGNLVLTRKYGLDPANPSESVMNKINRWFDTLTQAVKSSSSTSSSSSSSSGSSGSASDVPAGDRKAFLKLPIDNNFGVDKTKMYADLKSKSGRVKRWLGGSDENLDKVYDIVKSCGMSPELFFAYELQEGLSGGLGWLNHTYYTGDPYGDAKSVATWAVATAKSSGPVQLAWVDSANNPGGPSMDVREQGTKDANSLPSGSIGRMYLQGTAAATWAAYAPEWLKGSVNGVQDYGDPIQGCMDYLQKWKGSSSSSKSSSSNASPSNSSNSSNSSSSSASASNSSSSSGGSSGSGKGKDYIATLAGRIIGSGQCYALTSQYAAYIDPQHIGGGLVGGMAAADIGKDYPWDKWGWEVVNNPKYSDLRPGDILNFKRGGKIGSYGPADADWGHTGIIGNVMGNNQFEFYDQNPGAVKKTVITWTDGGASSIIHPPGSVAGSNSGSSNSSSASTANTEFKWKLSDAEQEKIYNRVVAKYTKAYEDSIKVSTAESSSASNNNNSSTGSSSGSSNDYSDYLPQNPTINGDGTGGSSTGGSNSGGSSNGGNSGSSSGSASDIIIDGNGNFIVPPNAGNNVTNTTNNYYEKVDEEVDKEKLRIIEEILNSVRLVGGYTKNNLDTIKKILEELEQSNTLLDSNNDLSETTNRLLQQLKFGNNSNGTTGGITGDVSESGSLDFLLDISPMQPIIQGIR